VISALYRCLRANEPLTSAAVLASVKATVPLSVTRQEDITELRESARGRFTPVA
jgi:hypothetical protein